MLSNDICRTCALQDGNLLPLSTHGEKYAVKSFCDMLHALTQNDPLLEQTDDKLPQFVCRNCSRQLEAAFGFVLQVRQVHEQLLRLLQRQQLQSQTQCLDETPIDISMQHIKTEIEPDNCLEQDVEADQGEVAAALKWQPETTDSDTNLQTAQTANHDVDYNPNQQLRRSTRKTKLATDSEHDTTSVNSQAVPPKRRRGRPPRVPKKEAISEDGRHICEVCGKTFSWYRDMQRHAKIHFEQAAYECGTCGKSFLRKDKYMFHVRCHEKREAKSQALQLSSEWRFAERLYSSGRLKRIECKLCGLRCQRIQELREHLKSHDNLESLAQFSAQSDVSRELFPGRQLLQIKKQVCLDIAQGKLNKYYVVINAHGYELCLSDSDEEPADQEPRYQCLPCNTSFTRKYRLMRHTLEEHTQAEASLHRCNLCQIGFVCPKLLEQHQRTQCKSSLKRYSCSSCPGKFIWQQSLQQHACSQALQKQDNRHFLCCLCDEQLPSMSKLRVHLHQHSDGCSGIDQSQSAAFFRNYQIEGSSAEHIARDFEEHDYGRYFNACNSSGQELDFYDSDTNSSDVEQQHHTCTLCGYSAQRRTQLLLHQQENHSELDGALPHLCDGCGLSFVAEPLLQQHRRRVCGKRHVKFHCQRCNLHFIWQTNYDRHMQLHVLEKEDAEAEAETEDGQEQLPRTRLRSKRQTAAKLQCSECEKVFIWPKDLTRHKRIHQPHAEAQYKCSFCERKFHRKDGLKSHIRVHGEQQLEATTNATKSYPQERMPVVLTQLCRPNGCKQIQCMICLSRHTRISDLRTHLVTHQYSVEFVKERAQLESIAGISRTLYPELSTTLNKLELIERIQIDVRKGEELERFVCITNEAGVELSLDSSETDTDSETEQSSSNSSRQLYRCELCQLQLPRKHQLYAHHLERHNWQQAKQRCSHCQARFVSEQLLDHHYRTLCRNTQKQFLCRKCPMRFRWRENLKLHTSLAHLEVGGGPSSQPVVTVNGSSLLPVVSYDCVECNRSFKMQKDLTRHTLMHAQESSIYRCRWCARRFYRKANLLQHIERHGISAEQLPYAETLLSVSRHPHGQKCIQCRVCQLSFSSITALRQHILAAPNGTHHPSDSMLNYSITNQLGYELHLEDSETDEETKPEGTPTHYTCGICQLRCVRKYELHQHQQAMHRVERISDSCGLCIFKSVSPDLIAYHRRVQCGNTEKQFKCNKCGYKFMWESNLLLHMQLEHTGYETKEEAAHTEILKDAESQQFRCGQCPRKYNRKDRLTAHVKKYHALGASAVTKSILPPAKQQKSFLCAFCGKAVSSSSNLIIHIRRHTGEKPFKCDLCDMAFPRSSDLQCHRRTHTGERPHICTVCQKGFARSYKLQQHMRIHNGDRPYKCTYCDKRFTQSNDLTLHIRRHTGERPYQCNTCGERFIQGTALKNHRLQYGHYESEEVPPKRD